MQCKCQILDYCKGPFTSHLKTNIVFPNSLQTLVCRNMYCSAACMIVCVLRGIPVLGAMCACQEWSSKGIWTLIVPYTRRLIQEGQTRKKVHTNNKKSLIQRGPAHGRQGILKVITAQGRYREVLQHSIPTQPK